MPVHSLDQYTSGVFCMAINAAARHDLIEQNKAHTMKRSISPSWKDGRAAQRHLAELA